MKKIELYDLINKNCMDYAEYVILERAIPDVRDGNKNIHRRILWSMNIDGLQHNKNRTKSINASGSVLRFSPHGDSSVYQAMVRLTNDSVNYPLIDGKGSFGSITSKEIHPGAARYTEMRLAKISQEYLTDINKNAVNMQDNYDNTRLEPEVLPVTFPTILCQPNTGIAVGVASNICPYPLNDVIDNTINIINGQEINLMIPDFTTGGYIVHDKEALQKVHNTGQGGIKIRCKYHVEGQSIVITEIPYTTTRESIINSVVNLVKEGKIKEIIDINDYSGLHGLNITIDIKRNTDVDLLMKKLYKLTTLEDTFSCNFTVINHGRPMVLGVGQILKEWVAFRRDTVKRILNYDLNQKQEKYHLLQGLEKILLDIDKTIDIIRNSEDDNTIKALMNQFNIDEVQAESVANMKLRSINKTNIIKQLKSIDILNKDINKLKATIGSSEAMDNIIIEDLERVKKTYGRDRISEITYDTSSYNTKDLLIEDYNCRIFYTKSYIKKHLKQSDNHKIKEDEIILGDITSTNKSTLLIFTNKANRYKLPVHELDTVSPSNYGQFIPSLINLEEDEEVIKIVSVEDNKGFIVAAFENGKVSKVKVDSFLSNNKKLMNCFNVESKLIDIDYISKDKDIFLLSNEGKGLIFNTERINAKGSRNTQGNIGIKLNEGFKCVAAIIDVTKEDRFTLHTQKGKEIRVLLDDISPKEDTAWIDYIYSRPSNQGNFIYNTRSNNDLITSVEIG